MATTKDKTKRRYLIPVLTKALDILELLEHENEPMVLEAIHKRTKISKTTVYRILKTLVHRGYVGQGADRTYRRIASPKKLRFGFGSQSSEMPFSEAVTASLREAATAVGVDLLVLDNRYEANAAIENAETFIREHVDIVIEFQIDEHVAPIIADRIAAAGIPLIAVDIPHPRATYFGVDNYRAGLEAGGLLADHALNRWEGNVDWTVGLDLEEAGQLVQSRITGAFEGIKSRLPNLPVEAFVRIDGRGMRDKSYRVVLDFLNRHPKDKHVLIAAANDTSAMGAIEAVRSLGREKHVAVVGQDCVPEMVVEMQRKGSPAIASISHEAYGPKLIDLGLSLLRGEKIAPYNYAEHKAITADMAARMLEQAALAVVPKEQLEDAVPAKTRGTRKK
ncbi:MAG: substrate-binding domain-containing protein [Acidobacteriaceae bacterium]|nr:substrate-binding domain-containing protein [Acidobacteriaceae bacterium]